MMYLKRLHYRKLQTPAVAFTAMGLVTILLAVVYFADPRQHRWIRFGPFGGLQPSEFAKPALALFLAYFIAMRSRAINSRYTLLPAILAVGFVTVSVALADLGTAIVLGRDRGRRLHRRRTRAPLHSDRLRHWHPRRARCLSRPNPTVWCASSATSIPDSSWSTRSISSGWIRSRMKKSITAKDTNYQSEQAKIAIGSGGPMGVGLMEGRQKLFYLPEAHTDTIYAVVGEEFGLVGSLAVLIGFVVILWRGIRATLLIPDEFGRYLALGITTMLVIQAFFNMTVVLGMMPTKGIPLPMISFGGSSLLVTLASLGILLNVSEHAGEWEPFVMAGGGTGGHVIPAIAVAREVRRMGHEVLFVGTERGVENRLVPEAGFRLEKIRVGGIKNLGAVTRLVSLWRLARETVAQHARFGEWKPGAVFSMGGYVAGPPVLAALLRGTPVVVMEPNAVPGFTNRHIARWVNRALIGFEETARFFPAGRTELTGLPVREEFFALPPKSGGEEFTVLITGGSQGSRTLNDAARQSWPLFREAALPVRLIHQTGAPMVRNDCGRVPRRPGSPARSRRSSAICRPHSPRPIWSCAAPAPAPFPNWLRPENRPC